MNQRLNFLRDGVDVFPALFDPRELLDGWIEARSRLTAGILKRRDRFVSGPLDETPGPLGPLEDMASRSELITCAEALLQSPVELSMSRLLLKDSGWAGAVELHQDFPYFPTLGHAHQVSFFVPLLTVQSGGLIFVKESHKLGPLPRGTIDRCEFPVVMEDFAPEFRAGDVIAMHWLTWHYSHASTTPDPRPVMQITYRGRL